MKITKTLALNILAVISLTFFASCNSSSSEATTSTTDSTAQVSTISSVAGNGAIVYLRMDSLMTSYGMYMDLSEAFNKKQLKIQSELETKARSLQNEVTKFQNEYTELSEQAQKGQITQYQGQKKQEELQKKQLDLQQKENDIRTYQESVYQELAQEEAVMTNQISAAILSYLEQYNKEKQYSMILQTVSGNPIILADPALDITADVLQGLNAQYDATL